MTDELDKKVDVMDQELDALLSQNTENELDLRRNDQKLKIIQAKTALLKAKADLMKTKNDEKRIMLDFRRLELDEFNTKYKIASENASRTFETISQTMMNLFPKEDKNLQAIMKADERVQKVKEEPY